MDTQTPGKRFGVLNVFRRVFRRRPWGAGAAWSTGAAVLALGLAVLTTLVATGGPSVGLDRWVDERLPRRGGGPAPLHFVAEAITTVANPPLTMALLLAAVALWAILVTDPVAGCGGCSGRCCPDGDRVGRQVAARSTRAARQRPCGHSRRLPVGAHGNGARVHGDPGRAGWARASAVQPGSYPRSDRMDDARGLELALAALPLALRCAGRGPAGSAAAMAALPLALVPRRATKAPVRGHRSGDRVPGVDCASTRPNSVALSHSYLAWSSQRTRYSRRTQKGERNFTRHEPPYTACSENSQRDAGTDAHAASVRGAMVTW